MGEVALAIQPKGAPRPALPTEAGLLAQADRENFPVITRLVPRAARDHLLAVYAFARLTDDLGDEHPGDRSAALDWLEGDLRAALEGRPSHPVTARLGRTIAATDLTPAPFFDLIAANRRDQTVARQETWDELLDYCRLSANPIGTAVLAIAGALTPERQALSDRVCTGLQIVEHLQDVGEDAAAGRVYLPADDLKRFGVMEPDLAAPAASPALRSAVAFELARARELLAAGIPLVRSLRGWSRLAVAGYVAGGLAAADAIEAANYDVLAGPVGPSRARTLRHALQVLASPEPRSRHGRRQQPDLDRAYAACAEVTRRQAKNFAYGIALLPPPKRRAMAVVYALARRVDDIVDETGPTETRARAIDELQTQVTRTMADGVAADPDDVVLVALADVVRRYPLPPDAVADLFEGCRRDLVLAHIATFDELVVYCRKVAGSIGRLSLAIFGADRPEVTTPLADDLGVALQLTNILRDVVEDRDQLGRVYLPADDLARFDCAPDASGPADRLAALVTFEAERARGWYERGLGLLPHLDHRSRACVAAMAGIYHRLLDHIERDPAAVLRGRVSLTTAQKVTVAARSLLPFQEAARRAQPWPDRPGAEGAKSGKHSTVRRRRRTDPRMLQRGTGG
ncbi:MAG TPA: squalene synthase HpnC [Acidimicrobiales bacterium]|nr:squalene synthase HpnC [Acidimicrobiales bacterium]